MNAATLPAPAESVLPRARASDPLTSHVAAASALPLAKHHAALIIAALAKGPGTIYALAERSGLDHVAVARRMKELERQSLVRLTGETAPSPSGRPCGVWDLPL